MNNPVHHPDSGLTAREIREIDAIVTAIEVLRKRVEAMPRHRHISMTITKLDEAKLWLLDRVGTPA